MARLNRPTPQPSRQRVLMVCMGNICRSPTAEAVLRRKLRDAGLEPWVDVDSAGTHADWHAGEAPHERSQARARKRGYDLSGLRARRIEPADFECFDLILAMDYANLALLEEQCPLAHRHKLGRLSEYARRYADCAVIPDPYGGKHADFEHVLDLVEDACDHLVEVLRRRVG